MECIVCKVGDTVGTLTSLILILPIGLSIAWINTHIPTPGPMYCVDGDHHRADQYCVWLFAGQSQWAWAWTAA